MKVFLALIGFSFLVAAGASPARADDRTNGNDTADREISEALASPKKDRRPQAAPAPHETPGNRVASFYVAESFINEQLATHVKSDLARDLKVQFDTEKGHIFVRGVLHVPTEELRAINLDPKMGKFRFQLSIKLDTTKQGHLILEFPLEETYFYPADSKDDRRERVIVPVQMLSLGLASARGYLAALSGDFGGFDRKTAKLGALLKSVDRSIAQEKNADAREDLENQRQALKLQLQAVPIERKQLQSMSKEVGAMLGFTGEKELNLNDGLAARKNALVLKVKLSQIAPYLDGVELGGVRVLHDKKDGAGENYFAIDINSVIEGGTPAAIARNPSNRPGMTVAPALMMRLNQSLFESEAVVSAEKQKMGSNLKEFNVELKDDGMHVSGRWKTLLFFSVPFDTVVDFASKTADQFEVKVRDIKVAGIDFEFLSNFVLESLKKRLDQSLKGICKFSDAVNEADHSRALIVSIDPKALVPAFPDLHLVGVDVRDREFVLKIGKLTGFAAR